LLIGVIADREEERLYVCECGLSGWRESDDGDGLLYAGSFFWEESAISFGLLITLSDKNCVIFGCIGCLPCVCYLCFCIDYIPWLPMSFIGIFV
jgi:hypothetical protein